MQHPGSFLRLLALLLTFAVGRLVAARDAAMIGGSGLQLQEHQAELLPLPVDEPGIARAIRFGCNG